MIKVLAVIAIVLLGSTCSSYGEQRYLLPLGDSITYGLESTDSYGYRGDLQGTTKLGTGEFDFVGPYATPTTPVGSLDNNHAGVVGERTDEIEDRTLSTLSTYMGGVEGYRSRVVLMAGTNDITQLYDPVGGLTEDQRLDTYVANVEDIIDIVDTFDPRIRVLIMTIPPMVDARAGLPYASYNVKLTAMVNGYDKYNLELVDTYTAFMDYPGGHELLIINDAADVHPNDTGYEVISDTLYPYVVVHDPAPILLDGSGSVGLDGNAPSALQ